jgi:hypothetical protein
MHVALADAQSHEFVHYLAMHFMMESVAIARNNYLGKYGTKLRDVNRFFVQEHI